MGEAHVHVQISTICNSYVNVSVLVKYFSSTITVPSLMHHESKSLAFRGKDLCYYMRGSIPLGLKRNVVQYSAWNRRRTHLVVVKHHPSTRVARVSQRLQMWQQRIFTSKLLNSNTEMNSDRLSKKIALTFVKLSGGTLNFQ